MEKVESEYPECMFYRGEMTKPIVDMNFQEREEWKKEVNKKIRIHLFSIGMPLVHKIDGNVVAEFADGTIEIIR